MRATSFLLFAAMATCAGGCIPQVGHSPRVEPGRSTFITGSLTRSPALQDEQLTVMPAVHAGMNWGWVRENGTAASLGVQIPVLAVPLLLLGDTEGEVVASLFMLDGYVQPVRAREEGGIDAGVGTMLSTGIIAPYVQAGRAGDGGIYTTQAVAWTYRALNKTIYWLPSVSLRSERADGSRAVDYFVGGGIGWLQYEHRPRDIEWFISTGVVLELRRKRP